MSLSGVEMLFFLPAVFAVYWLLPRKAALQNAVLLLASGLFCLSWSPRLAAVLLVAIAVDYWAGRFIGFHREQSPGKARIGLAISLAYNLLQLGYFKYAGFFAEALDSLLRTVGLGAPLPVLHVALPVGLSFYTFQKLSYVIDVYWGRQEPCRAPLQFATFVAFFPQLTAGPIPRAGDLLPEYAVPRRFDLDVLRRGAGLFFLGYVKKAYVADYLGKYVVDPAFASPGALSTAGHWLALGAYAAQVYCDFAGYSEMAVGAGRLFGLELPRNFNYPFLSRTPAELWRRWHITLNTWLFDYIYNPLVTGEGRFRGRLDLGFLVVFLASGLWHGARWTFLSWGLLQGIALVVHRRWDEHYKGLCRRDRKFVALRKSRRYATAAWAATQLYFVVTLLPFRAPSLAEAGRYLLAMVAPHPGKLLLHTSPPPVRLANLVGCLGFVIADHWMERRRAAGLPSVERFFALPSPVRGAVYGLVIVWLLLFVPLASGTFIYAQF